MRFSSHPAKYLIAAVLFCACRSTTELSRAGASRSLSTGLTGTATRGPTAPVCRIGTPCDAPLAATFDVLSNGHRVASFKSDQQGRFAITLTPGTYVIVPAADAPLMNAVAQAKTVTVNTEGMTKVELHFDTAIR